MFGNDLFQRGGRMGADVVAYQGRSVDAGKERGLARGALGQTRHAQAGVYRLESDLCVGRVTDLPSSAIENQGAAQEGP